MFLIYCNEKHLFFLLKYKLALYLILFNNIHKTFKNINNKTLYVKKIDTWNKNIKIKYFIGFLFYLKY